MRRFARFSPSSEEFPPLHPQRKKAKNNDAKNNADPFFVLFFILFLPRQNAAFPERSHFESPGGNPRDELFGADLEKNDQRNGCDHITRKRHAVSSRHVIILIGKRNKGDGYGLHIVLQQHEARHHIVVPAAHK